MTSMTAFLAANGQPVTITPVGPAGSLAAGRRDAAAAMTAAPSAAGNASWAALLKSTAGCVAMAIGVSAAKRSRKQGGVARWAAAPQQADAEAGTAACACGTAGMSRRQQAAALTAAILGTAGGRNRVSAEVVKVTETDCVNCGGVGTVECFNCGGTGQFKMVSVKSGGAGGLYQYVDCPDCNAVGQRVCELCVGTGLPAKKLRGFLRDPAYRKILNRLKDQSMNVQNMPEIRKEVKEAVALAEAAKAAKA